MNEKFISQSMYKDYADYKKELLCGIVFHSKWIENNYPEETTEVQSAGWWFEDMVVRGESSVAPIELKKGGYNVLYRNLNAHIPLAKKMLLNEGKIISSNETEFRGNVRVKRDVVVETNDGKIKVIDIKTTAHLKNKWDYWAWGALIEGDVYSRTFQEQRGNKAIQSQTYMCVPVNGVMPDEFEYWIFSSKDDGVSILSFNVEDVEGWYQHLEETFKEIYNTNYFNPLPEFERCSKCPLASKCTHRSIKPKKMVI